VLKSQLPWLDGGVLRRLLSAYDVDGSGLIKYVKLTVSLICASRPAMANLIVLLSRIEEERQEKKRKQEEEERAWDLQQAAADSAKVNAVRRYKHSSTDSHSHIHDAGTEALPSGLPRHPEASISSTTTSYKGDFGSEKYLLQLLHGL
jgi:thiamine pyrophosphate-dependent acetolactate synthase large subunit-like protein